MATLFQFCPKLFLKAVNHKTKKTLNTFDLSYLSLPSCEYMDTRFLPHSKYTKKQITLVSDIP